MFASNGGTFPSLLQPCERVFACVYPYYNRIGRLPVCQCLLEDRETADYLFVFAQAHEEYRIPELQSIAELYNIKITFPEDISSLDVSRPFMVFGLESEEDARKLARRCILIK